MVGSMLRQQLKIRGKAQTTASTQGHGNLQLKKALKSSSLSKSKREYSQLGLSVLEGKPTWRQSRQCQEGRSPNTPNTSSKEMKIEGKEQTVLRQSCLLGSLGIISLADTIKMQFLPHDPQAMFTSAPSHTPLATAIPYLHQVGHRRTEVLGDHGQQQGVVRQNFMPKESSPCDLGGRAQKLGREEEKREQRRISVLESPPLSSSTRRQQQITPTVQARPRHPAGTTLTSRMPSLQLNTRADRKFCTFYSAPLYQALFLTG